MAQRSPTAWHTRLLQAAESLRRARLSVESAGGAGGADGTGAEAMRAGIDEALRVLEGAQVEMHAAATLSETFEQLDQLVWSAWSRKIAPDSALTREGSYAQAIARVLSEGDEASRLKALEESQRTLASTRRMTAALIAAVAQAAERFASRHVMRFGVDSIEKAAVAESTRAGGGVGGGRLGSTEAAAWRKYKELMGETAGASEANIEAEILRAVAEFAEALTGTLASAERDNLSESQREVGGAS